MKLKIILALLMFSLVGVTISEAGTREPVTSLKQALVMADKYIENKNLDISSLFLASIYRSEFPENTKQNNWTIIWEPKAQNILDGELRIYIFDDGRIEHGGSA